LKNNHFVTKPHAVYPEVVVIVFAITEFYLN